MECQRAQGGVAPCAAATNKRSAGSNQFLLGEITDNRASIFDIRNAPIQMQGLTIVTAIAGAAAIVEVGHGKAALGPVLNARVEHRVTG